MNSASTTQKYFATARIDGVIFKVANGSLDGIWCGSSPRPWVTAWCQPRIAMPAIRNSTLNADHTHNAGGGVLPTRGSLGQLLVYVTFLLAMRSLPGARVSPSLARSVVAAHAVHQKNAVSERRCSSVSTVSCFIA